MGQSVENSPSRNLSICKSKMADVEVAPQVNYFPSLHCTVGPESDFEANFVLQTMNEWLETCFLIEAEAVAEVVEKTEDLAVEEVSAETEAKTEESAATESTEESTEEAAAEESTEEKTEAAESEAASEEAASEEKSE